ncbi:MAG: pyridoxine 5'-phosphate synthase [Gammaproteobacteria bacterium]|nr:pyridoxine 5'-phosphate synthase [Gammaproteobacteria bacterium]
MIDPNRILLGVNVDHVATLRQARGTRYPDPVKAALDAEQAGADGITVHLREDARHIQERDVRLMAQVLQTRMNLEMAVTEAMVDLAVEIAPAYVCLVPEKREELTTEGGLDVASQEEKIKAACKRMQAVGTQISLFIDADQQQIDAAQRTGAELVELHTGAYADATNDQDQHAELVRIAKGATYAASIGLVVNGGHGLNMQNVEAIAAIKEFNELNIGHSLMADALFVGLPQAVKNMKALMLAAREPHRPSRV